jgi:Trypsin
MNQPTLSRALRPIALSLAASACLAGAAAAQTHPLLGFDVDVTKDTGPLQNRGDAPQILASFLVDVPGAPWLQLHLDGTTLAHDALPETGVLLLLTSVEDGAQQRLNARCLAEWSERSAYFNGDRVLVEVLAEPGTGESRVHLSGVTAGLPQYPLETQCGPTDDRVPSNDPRQGRIVPIGCTGWMIDDCKHCFLTAGHCTGSSLQTVEFNVPLSDPVTGANHHPPPEDQYAVDTSSVQTNGGQGTGNDWGYFGVFANPNTGLTPYEAMGDAYQVIGETLPPFVPGDTLRITGYGNDFNDPAYDNAQQTSTGTWVTFSGTLIQYQVDTEGGNSGSPVLHELTGLPIAIHTHGGCSTSGSGQNSGTALTHAGLQAALADPHGVCALAAGEDCSATFVRYCAGDGTDTDCPCGNVGLAGHGCDNSVGTGGVLLEGMGDPALNDVMLLGSNFRPGTFPTVVAIRGTTPETPAVVLGDGLRCVGTTSLLRITSGVAALGELALPITHGAGPGTFYYQLWYRQNPASYCNPEAFNLSNGLAITWP